jgi:hypothetical protein
VTAGSQISSSRSVGGIEQTIKRSTACLHTDGHCCLGEATLLHGRFDLIGENLFDGLFLALFQNALFGQKTIKRRTNLTCSFFSSFQSTSFIRLGASRKSWAGVFCVFLTKP